MTDDEVLAESRTLVRRHGARITRLWFLGAGILLLAGLVMALLVATGAVGGDGVDRGERLLGCLGVGGLGLFVLVLGLGQGWWYRRTVDRGTVAHGRIAGEGHDALVEALAGGVLRPLLGNLLPLRVLPLVPEETGRSVPARLFADEEPIADEAGYRCLRVTIFGRPGFFLVCNRRRRLPPPPVPPVVDEETSRFAVDG